MLANFFFTLAVFVVVVACLLVSGGQSGAITFNEDTKVGAWLARVTKGEN